MDPAKMAVLFPSLAAAIDSPPVNSWYPIPSTKALQSAYVGKTLRTLPAPAAILDVAVIRRNCAHMLSAVQSLGVGFRAHVKTHKTVELAKLQVGDKGPVKIVVSTVPEAEHLLPWLLQRKAAGDEIVYGLPVVPSAIPRLARIAHALGEGSVTFIIDHTEQMRTLDEYTRSGRDGWPGLIPMLVKIDTGYHRAGVSPYSDALVNMVNEQRGQCRIIGVYAHRGHSYDSASPIEALNHLKGEMEEAVEGAETLSAYLFPVGIVTPQKLTVTIGATPTATAAQSALAMDEGKEVLKLIASVKQRFDLELHAGVYPVLDMQQLAAAARPATIDGQSRLTTKDIALRIMTEVVSMYDEREKPEALIAAGSIVFGKDSCKSYPGFGVVAPWSDGDYNIGESVYDPSSKHPTGWIVGRIAQEHGILTWEGSQDDFRELLMGEKVMVWPNHACMAGPNLGWYYVVDSDSDDPNVVRDIWVRCRGW